MKTQTFALFFFCLTAVVLSVRPASAQWLYDEEGQVCFVPGRPDVDGNGAPDNNADTGDDHYQSFWQGDQEWVNFLWNGFSFDTADWDNGFGYENVDDVNLPLARTLNGLIALYVSVPDQVTSTQDYNGSPLRWGGNFAWSNIDELDGRCISDLPPYFALTKHGSPFDNWTKLTVPFFFETWAAERAMIIFHEARHAEGYTHNVGNWECFQGGSCDSHWDYWGANTMEVWWAWNYWYEAINTPARSKKVVKNTANFRLANSFRDRPPYWINCGTPEDPCCLSGIPGTPPVPCNP